jgi:ribosomal protein L7/L12
MTLVLGDEPAVSSLRLEACGPNKIQVIRVIREITRLGLKAAKELAESAPCVLAESIDATLAARFRAELESFGARVSGGGAVTPTHRAPPGGSVLLEDCGPNKIAVIKVIRDHTALGLRDAKELADSVPCAIEPRTTRPTSLRDDLVAVGARVR